MNGAPRLLPAGERALVVELGDEISPQVNARVLALAAALEAEAIPGVLELIPTYRSLLIHLDPLRVSPEALEERVARLAQGLHELRPPEPTVTVVPVCYGGRFGPDLSFVCQHTGLRPDEVVRLHTGGTYRIYMLGFTPGFPYLGGMDERIATPRLDAPRLRIPAGSVGIAGAQTGIYPIDSPGGWRIIGRTPLRLYDPLRDPPFLLAAGNYVRFRAISPADFDRIAGEVEAGTYPVETATHAGG